MNMKKLNRTNIQRFDGKPVTVFVGDWVNFKSDVEQAGRIQEIQQNPTRGTVLMLENPDGFEGEYLRYATVAAIDANRCWAD